jgi:hypothetical protein
MRHPSDYLPAYKAVPKSTRCSTKSSASRPKLELSPPTIFIDTRDQVFAEYAANTRTVNGRPFEQLYASPDTEHLQATSRPNIGSAMQFEKLIHQSRVAPRRHASLCP